MIRQSIIDASPPAYDSWVKSIAAPEVRDLFRRLRVDRGFVSDSALARAAGINQPTLARFMNGTSSTMEAQSFLALAHVLGVTLSELLCEVPLGSSVPAREVSRLMLGMPPEQQEQLLRIAQALKGPRPG